MFRPRTFIYFAAWSMVGLLLLYGLLTRDRLEVNVLHDRNPQFVVLSDGSIRNGYTVKLLNKIPEPRNVTVTIDGLANGAMNVVGLDQPEAQTISVELEPDRLKTLKIYVRQPREDVPAKTQRFTFTVEDHTSGEADQYTTTFEAPE